MAHQPGPTILSNIIIEIWAIESALLRSEKMLNGKKPERAIIPVKMTKALFYDSIDKIGFLSIELLNAMENGDLLKRHVTAVRRLMVSPSINTVVLRRDIAEAMIRYNGYYF